MKLIDVFLCLICITGVSLGQLLLRSAAIRMNSPDLSIFERLVSLQGAFAIGVYVSMLALWLYILTRVPLSFAFPFYGLCFLLVPLFAHLGVGDPVSWRTWVGGGIILIGISISSGAASA